MLLAASSPAVPRSVAAARPSVAVRPLSAAQPLAAAAHPSAYRWPLAGDPPVVVPFDPPSAPWLPGQRGVDLGATPGAAVFAAGDGTVAFAGAVAGVEVVSIDHADGLRTTYEPVRPIVHRGQYVVAGQRIGTLLIGLASCPASVSACLHWGLRRGITYLDPLLLLRPDPVRLLPALSRTAAVLRPAALPLVFDSMRRKAIFGVTRTGPGGLTPGGRIRPRGCRPVRKGAGSHDRARS